MYSCRTGGFLRALIISCLFFAGSAALAAQGGLYLVSVGIGDPDNMTVKARKLLERADIVFGMKRVREQLPELLQGKEVHEAGHGLFGPMARRDKPAAEVEAMEAETRRIVREGVKAGKTVVVLDYGDPTIYGPQTGYLKEFHDLAPEVVPGISSFNAANAALARGITDGGMSRSVIITAAMGARDGYKGSDTLEKLAETRSTMVFFTMGMKLPEVVRKLKQHYPGETPIAIVSHAGSARKQAVLEATLDTVVERTGGGELPFEHLIYVGDFLR